MNQQVQDTQVQEAQPVAESTVESNNAFAAGFAKARGDEPAAPKTEEAKPEVKQATPTEPPPTEQAPAPAAADEWEGVPTKVKAELESISAGLRHLSEERLRPFEGRWKQMQQVINEWQAAKTAGTPAGAPSQEQQAKAAVTSEKWEALKADFPEWAEAMEERLAAVQAIPTAPAQAEVAAQMRAELEAEFNQRLLQNSRAAMSAVVEMRHEGWVKTVKSPEFQAWRATQSPEVNALGASENALDAIKLLDLYKEARKKTASAAARLKSAEAPKGVPVTPAVESENDAFKAGFNKARGGG